MHRAGIEVPDLRWIIAPWCGKQRHWVALVADVEDRLVTVLDSLGRKVDDDAREGDASCETPDAPIPAQLGLW